jgi:pimeloyl-ACP methyl ester carboxylesterase
MPLFPAGKRAQGRRPAEKHGSWQEELADLQARLAANPSPDQRAAIALDLLALGARGPARDALGSATGEPIARMAAFLADLDAGDTVLREVTRTEAPDPRQPVRAARATGTMLALRAGATRLRIVFTGTTRGFAIPTPAIADRRFHLLLVRDPTRCFALCGLDRLGGTYAECLASIHALATRLGTRPPDCVGTSAGGYAALRYGVDLGSAAVLAFSAPTTLDLRSDPHATLDRYPQLVPLYERDRAMGIDLLPLYRDAPRRPHATLVYCPSHGRDAPMAERMRGLPNVELIAVPPDVGHRVFAWANDTGRMAEFLSHLDTPAALPHPAAPG